MSLNKTKRVAQTSLTVGLTITTTLWMVGASFLAVALPAYALDNEAVVTDVTGDNPRIAANGESERVMLGLNLARVDDTDSIVLDAVRVGLIGDEAAASNIETVRLYSDSSLSGTNGVFDSNDALLDSVTQTDAKGGVTVDGNLSTANNASTATCLEVSPAIPDADLAIGDFVKVGVGASAEITDITGIFDDTLCATVSAADNLSYSVTALSAAPAGTAAIREINDLVAANTEGFQAYAGGEVTVELGDFDNDANTPVIGYNIPKTDSGAQAGDDVFVVLVTGDGAAGQEIVAQVFSNDIQYRNTTDGADILANVSTGTDTTDGKTKSVLFGADGDAPTITKVETYDNNKNGRVDRVKVYFSESMAATETSTANFKNAIGGTASKIEAGGDDIDLSATGTWMTTTVLNDTFQVDFTGDTQSADDTEGPDGEYSKANRSTGDQWNVIYDADGTGDFADATGELLADATVQTTDKARPEMLLAKLVDNDGDDKVDQLEVTWSERLNSASDAAGYTLTNTTKNPDKDYTLGAVTSMKKSAGADANTNDTLVIAVTEDSVDVNDTFNLDYAASATTTDVAGNEGNSETNLAATIDVAPRIKSAQYQDADFDGMIDQVLVTFTRNVDLVGAWEGDFTIAGYTGNGQGATTDNSLIVTFTEKTHDTDATPQLTYTKVGDGKVCLKDAGGDANCTAPDESPLANVTASDVTEEDKAAPVLLSATFYDNDEDGIWESGDTLQLLFSEPIDAGQVSTGWNEDGADGSVFTDWLLVDPAGGDSALTDAETPDSGTISVTGRVVTLTASENATAAIPAGSEIDLIANEIKDAAGNSAVVLTGGLVDLALDLTPAAPAVTRIETRDMDGNGVVDGLEIQFGGMIAASSIDMAEFAAARSANAFGTTNVTPDLTITSVTTVSGGDDTRLLVRFNEANEGTGALPAVKYVAAGTLQDLAGNDIANFNEYAADDTKFASPLAEAAVDGADPVVLLKRLRDRNMNGQYDQLVLVFSEDMDPAGTTSTDGWDVENHTLASAGAWFDNDGTYDAYTFASTDNVFRADILESGAPTSLPGVSYASTGAFADNAGLVLGDVAAGGEESPDITEFNEPADDGMVQGGELFRLAGSNDIWVAKHVDQEKFRRHVLWGDFDTIYPHLAPMWPVQEVSQAVYDEYTHSAWIRVVGTTAVYEVNDDATAHHITCDDDAVEGEDCANEWVAAGGNPQGIYEINGEGGEWGRLTVSNPVVLPDVAN